VQIRQDGAADAADQVRRAGDDVADLGDGGLGSLDGDLVAGPVRVGARDGLHGVGDGDPSQMPR
jgi:hypothetical protein